eukprot:5765083-Alexandrium_andersonii.AAC.1
MRNRAPRRRGRRTRCCRRAFQRVGACAASSLTRIAPALRGRSQPRTIAWPTRPSSPARSRTSKRPWHPCTSFSLASPAP